MNTADSASGHKAKEDKESSHSTKERPRELRNLGDLNRAVRSLAVEMIAQEHRTVQVWRNLISRLGNGSRNKPGELRAAASAVARWFFFGRPVILSLALGGFAAAFLALQANLLLTDQNIKLDLQNHLMVIQSHQSEAQRSIDLGRELTDLIADVSKTKQPCPGLQPSSFCIDEGTKKRLAEFSQLVRPYRLIETDSPLKDDPLQGTTRTTLTERFTAWLFGSSRQIQAFENSPVPRLSERRLSPERGELLRRLVMEEQIALASFTHEPRITFEAAYLPYGSFLTQSLH